jgi:cytochrome c
MACHGDKGQGLSNEWRGALDPADQNCWQSRCHASNFPPGGFVFPKIVPAVASPGMLARFDTALELYHFLKQSMPFQAPGSLSEEEYWQLTAFLLSLNGIDPGAPILGPEQAAFLKLHPQVQAAPTDSATMPIVLSGAGLAVLIILWVLGHKNRKRSVDG